MTAKMAGNARGDGERAGTTGNLAAAIGPAGQEQAVQGKHPPENFAKIQKVPSKATFGRNQIFGYSA